MIERRLGGPLNVLVVGESRPYGPFDAEFMTEYEEMWYQHEGLLGGR